MQVLSNIMIAAICYRVNDRCKVKMYLAGTYNQINWDTKYSSVLGENFVTYNFKEANSHRMPISIDESLNGGYILRIIETRRYILKVEGEWCKLPHFQNEENKFLKCDKDEDLISFQFVNYLGRTKLFFECEDVIEPLVLEVVPDKIDYEDDYVGLTEALAQICSSLLLEYSGATSNVYSQSEGDSKTLLEQFIFLRQFCYSQNLQSLFESVKRNPDSILVKEETYKPLGCGQPSKKIYTNPFSYGKKWGVLRCGVGETSVYLPQEIAVTQKYNSFDTPANRFMKFAFQKFDTICTALIDNLDGNGHIGQAECVREANAIHEMLERIFRDSFFDEIGSLDIMPQNNQVLQKREGYSQIFSAYSMLDLALQLDWRGKDAVYDGESKNVALLYEYWLFFELYKIIMSIDGCEMVNVKENPFMIIEEGLSISLEEGKESCQAFEISPLGMKINLYYNRIFSGTEFQATKYEGSYSRPFRPDYTLAIYPSSFTEGRYNGEEEAIRNGAVSYIHFDAKYRISDLTTLMGRGVDKSEEEKEIVEDKLESVINTYKRGDLLKMHTYNDAIRRTIGSYVLYPGSKNEKGKKFFRLYDEILPGVGAFAIKPSISTQGESELRTFIVDIIETKRANNSRLNRMRYYAEMVLKEPSAFYASNLNVRRRGGKHDEKSQIVKKCVLGYIRADSGTDYYFFLRDNGLLKKGAEFLFYFYAIKGNNVYSHHKDIFNATIFRFYTNKIRESNTYKLEPVLCKILSNELIPRTELVARLKAKGYETNESRHHADFYYILSVKVEEDMEEYEEIKISEINARNGNDTFSPHSPKVICY